MGVGAPDIRMEIDQATDRLQALTPSYTSLWASGGSPISWEATCPATKLPSQPPSQGGVANEVSVQLLGETPRKVPSKRTGHFSLGLSPSPSLLPLTQSRSLREVRTRAWPEGGGTESNWGSYRAPDILDHIPRLFLSWEKSPSCLGCYCRGFAAPSQYNSQLTRVLGAPKVNRTLVHSSREGTARGSQPRGFEVCDKDVAMVSAAFLGAGSLGQTS